MKLYVTPGRQPSWIFENAQALTQFTRRIMYMGHLGHPNQLRKKLYQSSQSSA